MMAKQPPENSTLNPTQVQVDNDSAVKIATNRGNTRRRKHFGIRHRRIQLAHNIKQIQTKNIATELNKSDILTKALGKLIHRR